MRFGFRFQQGMDFPIYHYPSLETLLKLYHNQTHPILKWVYMRYWSAIIEHLQLGSSTGGRDLVVEETVKSGVSGDHAHAGD